MDLLKICTEAWSWIIYLPVFNLEFKKNEGLLRIGNEVWIVSSRSVAFLIFSSESEKISLEYRRISHFLSRIVKSFQMKLSEIFADKNFSLSD